MLRRHTQCIDSFRQVLLLSHPFLSPSLLSKHSTELLFATGAWNGPHLEIAGRLPLVYGDIFREFELIYLLVVPSGIKVYSICAPLPVC